MNTQTSYFKKALVMLMAVIMVFTYMPSIAWADSTGSETPEDSGETIKTPDSAGLTQFTLSVNPIDTTYVESNFQIKGGEIATNRIQIYLYRSGWDRCSNHFFRFL